MDKPDPKPSPVPEWVLFVERIVEEERRQVVAELAFESPRAVLRGPTRGVQRCSPQGKGL